MTMTAGNDDLSIGEIAALAGVTEGAVRQWFDSGKLAVSRTEQRGHQRRRYASKADVEALLAQMGRQTPKEATRRPAQTPDPGA